MEQKEIQCLLNSLEVLRAGVNEFVIPDNLLSSTITQLQKSTPLFNDDFIELIQRTNEIISIQRTEQPHFFAASSIPISEIIFLLKDIYQGKMSDYLQEVLSNAEIELLLTNQTPGNPNGHKELEIKIKLAATVIDKYSGILQMIIGKKSLAKKDEIVVQQAHQALDLSASRLRRINLVHDINQIQSVIDNYISEHSETNCFSFLFSGRSKAYKALTALFANLTADPLSEQELIGAICLVAAQLNLLSRKEQEAVSAAINQLLISNHYLVDTINSRHYIAAFVARADVLKLSWPKPFALIRNKELENHKEVIELTESKLVS